MGTWIYANIQYLIELAVKYQDSTMVIYACFETRNFLEKIEFEIILAALTDSERSQYLPDLEKMHGLKMAFGDIIAEKAHAYISFMNALCKAKPVPFRPPGNFDFKTSTKFKSELNSYCHLYSRTQSDLLFKSPFIQRGLTLVREIFDHLKKQHVLSDVHGITIVGTPVSKLKGDSLEILEKFKRKQIKETDLVELLKTAKNQ